MAGRAKNSVDSEADTSTFSTPEDYANKCLSVSLRSTPSKALSAPDDRI